MKLHEFAKLNREQCFYAIKNGEFEPAITESAKRVAVVLTQAWCPQWFIMKNWIAEESAKLGARLFYIEYDKENFYEEFMSWKENNFNNRQIPYIRYYLDGKCVAESNFLGRGGFIRMLGGQ